MIQRDDVQTRRTGTVTAQGLTLLDELVLALLNEESGYFRQVRGWNLHCAFVGGALAELSFMSRVDTDLTSLILLDESPTGDPALDPILADIASEPVARSTQYWIERLAPEAGRIIDTALERLVDLKILQHHDGGFWSLSRTAWQTEMFAGADSGGTGDFVKNRISRVIFNNEIPDPRDVVIIGLIDALDLLRFIFDLDEESEQRVEIVCKMDLIGRSIGAAVTHSVGNPLARSAFLLKAIPVVRLHRVLRSRHLRSGNMAALFAELAEAYGPVFELRLPFQESATVLAGREANLWVHRHGRNYLRARDYLAEFEEIYGGKGLLPALDGADHFRYRKSMQSAYSRTRLEGRLEECYSETRKHMATWIVGSSARAVGMCRMLANATISPLTISIDTQDIVADLQDFKERALTIHVVKGLPKFMLHTPGMRRKGKLVKEVTDRVMRVHTPAQRTGCPRDLADDLLSMHTNDPQFLPESNLRFVMSTPLLAGLYVADGLCFAIHAMVSRPDLYEMIRGEADALFADGDPDGEMITGPMTDVTRRFIMECLRLYPVVPLSLRTVMNRFVLEGYEIREGTRAFIAQTATHFMSDVFPEPFSFDIDRYAAPRKEHVGTAYAPFGLGTHTCLGSRLAELHMLVNLLLIAHHFTIEIAPADYKLRIRPVPSMAPSRKLRFVVAEQRHELPG